MTVIWINGTLCGLGGRLSGHLCSGCGLVVWGGMCGLNRGGVGWGIRGRVSGVVTLSDSNIRASPECFLVPAAYTACSIRVTAPVISSLVVPLQSDSVFS